MAVFDNTTTPGAGSRRRPREVIIPLAQRRRGKPVTTARARIFRPCPKRGLRTEKPAETMLRHAAPVWAAEREAERLLCLLIDRAHIAAIGNAETGWGREVVLELTLPWGDLLRFLEFGIAREGLEPEEDTCDASEDLGTRSGHTGDHSAGDAVDAEDSGEAEPSLGRSGANHGPHILADGYQPDGGEGEEDDPAEDSDAGECNGDREMDRSDWELEPEDGAPLRSAGGVPSNIGNLFPGHLSSEHVRASSHSMFDLFEPTEDRKRVLTKNLITGQETYAIATILPGDVIAISIDPDQSRPVGAA